MSGGFQPGPFRTGSERSSNLENILKELNSGLGTAFASNDTNITNTLTYVENMAIARALNDLWECNRRLANQSDPKRMGVFIPRWEKILGLIPKITDSIEDRKLAIAASFNIWSKPPTEENVVDFLKILISSIFIGVEYIDPNLNNGSVPGGAVVPGGVALPDGPWQSTANRLVIRIWQKRDHLDNKLMTDNEFINTIKKFVLFLDNYLPTYVSFQTFRFFSNGPGKITTTIGSTLVTGSSTTFTSTFSPGVRFEGVDDTGNVQTYTVLTVTNDTNLILSSAAISNNTSGFYRISGFFLDAANNLDNSTFR